MAYTKQDLSTFVTNAIWQIDNASSRDAAQIYASNAINGLDTLLQYGSIDLIQHTDAMLTIQGVLNDYAPPSSAAPSYTQTAAQPNVSSQQSYSQQAGLVSSGAGTTAALFQQFGVLPQEATPWYKRPEFIIPMSIGGLILGIFFARKM